MQATHEGLEATRVPPTLDRALFDQVCEARGAYGIGERAALLDVDRKTIHRWYQGPVDVPLSVSRRVERVLGVSAKRLWPEDENALTASIPAPREKTEFLTVPEAARELRVCVSSVRGLIGEGLLAWNNVGLGRRPRIRISRKAIEEFRERTERAV